MSQIINYASQIVQRVSVNLRQSTPGISPGRTKTWTNPTPKAARDTTGFAAHDHDAALIAGNPPVDSV